MGSRRRNLVMGLVLGICLSGSAEPSWAQLSLGGQASSGEVSELGLGPRLVLDFGPLDAGFRVVGTFEIFFPGQKLLDDVADGSQIAGAVVDGDPDYWEANLNVLYGLGLPLIPIKPYLGAGINLAHTQITGSTDGLLDVDHTDQGVNLLAGVQLAIAGAAPFVEFRYELGGGEQWVVTGGIVF